MNKRNTHIEASDGIDVSLMGYTHSDLRMEAALTRFVEAEPQVQLDAAQAQPAQVAEKWWQAGWRILNTDIFELWRLMWPKKH